ncbi:hypothetical protein EV1_022403 [Malus domestica]
MVEDSREEPWEQDRIVVQPDMFSGGLFANKVTAGVEVVGSREGVPELEVSVDGGSVSGDKTRRQRTRSGLGGLAVTGPICVEAFGVRMFKRELGLG